MTDEQHKQAVLDQQDLSLGVHIALITKIGAHTIDLGVPMEKCHTDEIREMYKRLTDISDYYYDKA